MSDIFREVEEDVRREKLEKLWKAYGVHIIVLVLLGLIGVGGFQVWQRYEGAQRDKDSTAFAAAQHLTDPKAAAQAFAALAKTAHGGYGILARLAQANAMAAGGQQPQAIALYKNVANDDHGAVGAIARLRAGWIMADSAPRSDLQTLLQPLQDTSSAWRQMADEILAYADYRAGKTMIASAEFAKLAADPNAPDALRQRARAFAAFLAGGGSANYGTVPPPPPTPPAPGAPVAGATVPGPTVPGTGTP